MHPSQLKELRSRAENALKEGRLKSEHQLETADLQKILAELEIYQAELELQNKELIEAKTAEGYLLQRLETLFNALPLLALVFNARGQIMEANTPACDFFGFTDRASLKGHSIYRLFLSEAKQTLSHALRQPASSQDCKVDLINQQGETLPFLLLIEKLPQSYHLDDHFLLLAQNRSADVRLEQALEKAEHLAMQAEAASRAKSRFLATMSHEIRTPMNSMLNMARILSERELKPLTVQRYATTLLNSGEALLSLINDILDLSRYESGQLKLEETLFKPARILQEIQALFFASAQNKDLHFECEWQASDDLVFKGDPTRIRQILVNLTDNAIKFTQTGRVSVYAWPLEKNDTQSTQVGEGIRFQVKDTGIGIPADKQQYLFEPFFQGEDSISRRFGGTGLGLPIIKQLIDVMGASIDVESKVEEGSCFTLDLPLAVNDGTNYAAAQDLLTTQPTALVEAKAKQALTIEKKSQLASVCTRLDVFLQNNSFEALKVFDELQELPELCSETEFLQPVSEALQSFEFSRAREHLAELRKQLDIEVAEEGAQ